jgi:hypothetical protein
MAPSLPASAVLTCASNTSYNARDSIPVGAAALLFQTARLAELHAIVLQGTVSLDKYQRGHRANWSQPRVR